MKLFIDTESIPTQQPGALEEIRKSIQPPGNMSKAETIAKWMMENADSAAEEKWRKTALDGTKGELVVIGFATDDDPIVSTHYRDLDMSEGDLIQNAFDEMAEKNSVAIATRGDYLNPQFIGHNIIGFDIRFLFQRAVILGIKPPFQLPTDQRYNSDKVFDCMLAWAGWGNYISLDALCAALGIPCQSNGVDGSMVWDLVKAGRIGDVVTHCMEDVESVRRVYRRMTFQEVA